MRQLGVSAKTATHPQLRTIDMELLMDVYLM